MPSSNVAWDISGSIGILTFTRPHARNALTWDMYEALDRACAQASSGLRALIIRGSGGAFAAGTDIAQFAGFSSGEDGVAYEQRLDVMIDTLERVSVPTIAEVDGVAAGGGCLIALACDLRVCSPRARFGIPVSRTLGNCLSMANTVRLVDLIGPARLRDLMLTGRLVDAPEALALGFATRVVEQDLLSAQVMDLAAELATRAPSTVAATKALLSRLREFRTPPAGSADDIIAACYGSDHFREGVAAFNEGRPPKW
jgi:enoyl-CoA hydratase/carnithine racemase